MCTDNEICKEGHCFPDPAKLPKPPKNKVKVSDFKCYGVAIKTGAPRFKKKRNVMVVSADGTVGSYDVKKPSRLCSPVAIDGVDAAAPSVAEQLMCYKVALHTADPPQKDIDAQIVGTKNPFSSAGFVRLSPNLELCVPAVLGDAPLSQPRSAAADAAEFAEGSDETDDGTVDDGGARP